MSRNRKPLHERKREQKQEEQRTQGIDRYNAYGFSDPTPYEAVKRIIYKETAHNAHKGM